MDHETCHHLLSSLSGFIDQDLSPELCAEISRHLEGCENCRIVINTLQKTIDLYQVTAPETKMPAEVRQRLFARFELEEYLK